MLIVNLILLHCKWRSVYCLAMISEIDDEKFNFHLIFFFCLFIVFVFFFLLCVFFFFKQKTAYEIVM